MARVYFDVSAAPFWGEWLDRADVIAARIVPYMR
jgi:hypothetical protein